MITISTFKNKKVALFGLGESGLAAARALMAGGAEVCLWDDDRTRIEAAQRQNFHTNDFHSIDWEDYRALILAPGVPLTNPEPHWVVKLAQQNNVEIIGDIELFVRERNQFLAKHKLEDRDCPFIAITGTNGKSTTTALITHLLKQEGFDAQMGGNIGTAILALEPFAKHRVYVIECSSFQIDLTPSINPSVGLLLNITPDHIDRHGTFAHYAEIKERLVAGSSYALVGVDDQPGAAIFNHLKSAKSTLPVSVHSILSAGYYAVGTKLFYKHQRNSVELADLAGIASLRGAHNAQNALMALGALRALGITSSNLQLGLSNFIGLPHRMQQVRKIGRTLFIDDSKATNAEASAPALAAFDHIYWIIGGIAKEGGITSLKDFFPKIKKAYLIGEAADDFAETIGDAFPYSKALTMEKAVHQAARDAAHDPSEETAVLLSPACASYDQFANYGARGDAFTHLVNAL